MPTIRVEMYEGRTLDQKRELVRSVTDAVCSALGVEPRAVQIKINETRKEDSARGGILASDRERA